ncbi:MAG: hypothetical protein BWY06_02622 [Candidatus Latescibacteria bacterium ADurb.Bin168]|nr:MAG: hypothetical protein BWY06_02622 [Candidatus Latescibacteria bacterium ADurb.Bin168]
MHLLIRQQQVASPRDASEMVLRAFVDKQVDEQFLFGVIQVH